MSEPYKNFIGTWALIPHSCEYEQGSPPESGLCRIDVDEGELVITVVETDSGGREEKHQIRGRPDGRPQPFAVGDLIDTLTIDVRSASDLVVTGSYQGRDCMIAQRQLDESGQAMRLTQLVRFDSGDSVANISVFRRQALA